MPELPEVETIKSQLSNFLPLKIQSISFSDKTSRLIKQKDFIPKSGEEILTITRKGKFLIFKFNNPDHFIISHLGMSGSWRLSDAELNSLDGKHAHVIIKTDKKVLSYIDPRRFGHLYFLNKKNFETKLDNYPAGWFSTEHKDEIDIKKKLLEVFIIIFKILKSAGGIAFK